MEITRENAQIELYKFRAKNDVTQEKLSERTGVSKPTIVSIEKGRIQPRANTLHRINEFVKLFG